MLRHVCRALMAGVFIHTGVEALRHPGGRAEAVEDAADALPGDVQPAAGLPQDTADLVRLTGAVQVAAGSLLVLNVLPRTASLALAATVGPSTVAQHPWWTMQGDARRDHQLHMLKDLAMFGGLVITGLDTQGQPGIGWRAQHLVDRAEHEVEWRRREAELLGQLARQKALTAAAEAREHTAEVRARTAGQAKQAVKDARLLGRAARRTGQVVARTGRAVGRGLAKGAGASGRGAAKGAGATARGAKKAVKKAVPA